MSDRRFSLTALAIAVVVTVLHGLWLRPWMLDDAFIFFRYAENWAAGHGPVYNIGERVEGTTSFLWLVVLTLGKLGGFDVVDVSVVLGHVFALATLLLVSRSWRWLGAISPRTAAAATLFLGTCGVFTAWARSGMETTLHALLITATLIAYLHAKEHDHSARRAAAVGLLCTLASLSRPDALLVVAVLGVDAMLARRWRSVVVTGLVFLLTFGAYYAWRFQYFGYALPNTFYAKVGMTQAQLLRGLTYVSGAAIALLPFLVPLLALGRGGRRVDRHYLVLPTLLVVYTSYIVAVGGDVMPAHRFFTPVLPILCLLAAMSLRLLPAIWRSVGIVATVSYSLLFLAFSTNPIIRGDVVAHNGKVVGLWLREHAPRDAVVATNTAGTIALRTALAKSLRFFSRCVVRAKVTPASARRRALVGACSHVCMARNVTRSVSASVEISGRFGYFSGTMIGTPSRTTSGRRRNSMPLPSSTRSRLNSRAMAAARIALCSSLTSNSTACRRLMTSSSASRASARRGGSMPPGCSSHTRRF